MDTHYETTGADRPAYQAQFLTSYGTALNTVQAILAALVVRERCDRGQRVETSLLKATMNFDPELLPRLAALRPRRVQRAVPLQRRRASRPT